MSEHPGRLMLERYFVDTLSSDEKSETVEHLERCEPCRRRLVGVEEESARELARLPVARFMEWHVRRAQAKRVAQIRRWTTASLLAAAAAVLLIARRPRDVGLPLGDEVALRGAGDQSSVPVDREELLFRSTGVQIHRYREGRTTLMNQKDRLRSGDVLSFIVDLPKAAPVAVWWLTKDDNDIHLLVRGGPVFDVGEAELPETKRIDLPCSDMWVVVGLGPGSTDETEAALQWMAPVHRERADWAPKYTIVRKLECDR